jgi:hypothetical protein
MSFEPAHNHMGVIRPVPYDQLVVGAYTTREIAAGAENADEAVAAFNEELETPLPATPAPTAVPAGAAAEATAEAIAEATAEPAAVPAEITASEELLTYLETQHLELTSLRFTTVPADAPELHHALAEFQRRLENEHLELYNAWAGIIITQNQPGLKRIDLVIAWDEVQLQGGEVVLSPEGNPIPLLDENGNPKRRINSRHVFINEKSAYFD